MATPRLACRGAGVLAACVVLATSTAAAQTQPPERPFRPLYADEASAPRTSFVFAGSLHQGRGEEVGGRDEFGSTGLERRRNYTGGQLGLSYTRRGRRVILSAEATGGARYYRDLKEVVSLGHRAGAGMELLLGKARLQAAHTYRDTPFQQLLPLLGAEGESTRNASNPDSALASAHNVQNASTLGWRRAIGRRSELAFNYGYSTTHTADGSTQDLQQGGSAFRHRVGRGLELKLGHQARVFREFVGADGPRMVAHDLDLGVDVDRELSFSRRTHVGLTSGSSIVSSQGGQKFVATGQASLRRDVGRSWNATAAYGRKVDFIEGLPDAVVGHTTTLGIGGYLGRRLSVLLRGAAGSGTIGLESGGTYRSFTSEARASFALRRGWTAYVEHFYYQHTVSGAFLPAGVPPDAYRRGFRTGLDLRMDAIRRRR